jgi:UDP-N-acetylmuramoylalanine--D-glutamate ligase
MASRALVFGLAVAGEATARALLARGWDVVVADDRPKPGAAEQAAALGIELHAAPDDSALADLVAGADLVVPSPGVPERHALFAAARAKGVPVRTEIDLAYEWEQQRPGGARPILGVTGTDGKTTTTLLAVEMVEASGRTAVAAGNTEVPLVSALDHDVDVLVVECTSFRLAWIDAFRPDAGAWLNFAADHLDWHDSLDTYAAAKARLWEHQRPGDTAIGFAPDPIVMAWLARAPGRRVTFGGPAADYRVEHGQLTGPHGPLAEVGDLRRQLPHDLTNALAAAALGLEAGVATPEGVAGALATFEGVPHRISLVAQSGGVSYYDDSKATTPHAALTAVRAFDRVVLVAGGRNKGLDLGAMAAEPERVRAVVAIGEAAAEVSDAFASVCPVVTATSMDDAVSAAAGLAHAGDVVLLSPGCASFDWYGGYAERGDDFARAVRRHLQEAR